MLNIFRSGTAMSIAVKRVYEPAAKTDGYRVLIDRLWPRGLKKDDVLAGSVGEGAGALHRAASVVRA
jgi:hypothetical protein